MSISLRELLLKALEDKSCILTPPNSAECDINSCFLKGDGRLRIDDIDWYLCSDHFKIVKEKLEGL